MADRITELRAMQAIVMFSIEEAEPAKRAPLVNQWRALEATIESLTKSAEKSGDPLDEIAARRAARGGSTARSRRTGAGSS